MTERQIGDLDNLRELAEAKQLLRAREATLRQNEPWYRRPSNIIGLLAIVVPVALTTAQALLSTSRKELSIAETSPYSLVLFTPAVRQSATVMYNGKVIPALGRVVVTITNTGTTAVETADFLDGPLSFDVAAGRRATADSSVPFLLDVVVKTNAGQRNARLNITSHMEPAGFTYLPVLLNPGESVELEVYTSAVEDLRVIPHGKIREGLVRNVGTVNPEPDGRVHGSIMRLSIRLLFAAIGSKWGTMLLFGVLIVLGFITTATIWDAMSPIVYSAERISLGVSILLDVVLLILLVSAALTPGLK